MTDQPEQSGPVQLSEDDLDAAVGGEKKKWVIIPITGPVTPRDAADGLATG